MPMLQTLIPPEVINTLSKNLIDLDAITHVKHKPQNERSASNHPEEYLILSNRMKRGYRVKIYGPRHHGLEFINIEAKHFDYMLKTAKYIKPL